MLLTDPYAIFARARQALMEQRYPATVAYTVDVNVTDAAGKPAHRHYHEYWSADDGRVYVKPPVSDEQLAHPYKPSAGVNFMNILNVGGPREGTGAKDFIGVPDVAPNYTFGVAPYTPPSKLTPAQLVEQIRREYHDPAPDKIAALERSSGLKVIAVVSSVAHAYRITLAGVEAGANGTDYHLQLQPERDPLTFRLRDLWIDTATYALDRARIAGNFTDSATENVPWMVTFRQASGVTYIAHENAEKPVSGYHGLMYSRYSVTFLDPHAAQLPAFASMTPVAAPLVEP